MWNKRTFDIPFVKVSPKWYFCPANYCKGTPILEVNLVNEATIHLNKINFPLDAIR